MDCELVKLINLDEGDQIAAVARIADQEEEEEAILDVDTVAQDPSTDTNNEENKELPNNTNDSITDNETPTA